MKWARRKIVILASVIFIAHVIAIFALHTPAPMVALPESFRMARLMPPSLLITNGPVEVDGLNDPLVFAGAHQHGFSAYAWMTRPRPEYALTNSTPAPRYLAFSRTATAFEFAQPQFSGGSRTELPYLDFNLPIQQPKSLLFVQGELQRRPFLKQLEVPIQFGTDVLSNTVVQVGVKADGFPFSARVISGSGSRGADLTALNLANKARFAPLAPAARTNRDELQWGELVFQWFTAEPGSTNKLPKTAISAAK